MAGIEYNHATEECLAAGDILALITDGFSEWENPEGEEFGVTRLEAVLREAGESPAEEIISSLRSALAAFCRGTRQQDDLTAVILRRKAVWCQTEGGFNHVQDQVRSAGEHCAAHLPAH